MRTFNFQNTRGEKVEDVIGYIKNVISQDEFKGDFAIYIGCDSLPNRKKGSHTANYSTVICIRRMGKGAQVLYQRENNVPVYGATKKDRMKHRLWEEIYRTIDLSVLLTDSDIFDHPQIIDFQVHIDINPNEEFASNIIYKEAVGYINSMGLDVYAKPEAMAATYVSDVICRKGLKK